MGIRRRELLVAGAVGAVGAAAGERAAPATARRRRPSRTHDVVVVGAGLAGLTAARAVRRAGRSVVVLEARDRVGGRNLDVRLPGSRDVVELGGQWAGPGQDRVLALARELGVGRFDTYAQGQNVYLRQGTRHHYTGDVPPAQQAALGELALTIVELDRLARTVPAARPWTAPRAAEWDEQSVAGWIDARNRTAEARDLSRLAIRSVYGEEAAAISMLDLLASIQGVGGDFDTLIGSAQTIRFVGGPQQLSRGLARQLGRSVRRRSPVLAAHWGRGVTIHTADESFRGRRAILTLPRPLLARIRYDPPLPPAHDQLLQRQPMGSVLKFNAVYPTPFWRAQGLSGQATATEGPVEITFDNSPPSGRPGVLVGFAEGNSSRALYGASRARRRAVVLASLARLFGEPARHPRHYLDLMWAAEPYTRGAYGSYNPPGVLSSLGAATEGGVGPLHFAGADASHEWPGYMEGAIRSGEQAARDVLARL